MGLWGTQVVPRIVDKALGNDDVAKWRRRCVEGLSGTVVEPGFGSGLNVPHYPPAVTHVYAVDPSDVGNDLSEERVASSPATIERIGLDGESLALPDDSCDAGLLTFTLCTIPDHHQALAELRRVIRPGGTLHFLEHGLAPDGNVQRWQHRITPIQRRLFDGCHLNRPIVEDIAAAGFDILWSDAEYTGPPKPVTWFTVGHARNPD
ncbi:MAG: class I SAM-dependent methyltransferase [Actinomycetota bacterium]